MAGLGLRLELEFRLELGPCFSVRVSRVSRVTVKVNVKARAEFRVRVSDHVGELQSSCSVLTVAPSRDWKYSF